MVVVLEITSKQSGIEPMKFWILRILCACLPLHHDVGASLLQVWFFGFTQRILNNDVNPRSRRVAAVLAVFQRNSRVIANRKSVTSRANDRTGWFGFTFDVSVLLVGACLAWMESIEVGGG